MSGRQLYDAAATGHLAEVRRLIAAGASVTLHFDVNARELSTVMSDGSRNVPAGVYNVQVGGANPRDTRAPATPINGSVRVAPGCSAY